MKGKFTLGATMLLYGLFSINIAHAGSLRIIRFWQEYDYGYALIEYVNNTADSLKSGLTIGCTAINSEKKEVETNQKSLLLEIRPGIQTRMEVPVKPYGTKLESMKCIFIETK